MCDTFQIYQVQARVVPAAKNGWNSGGRQIPTFHVAAVDADAAAAMVVRVLLGAAPDADYVDVTTYRVTPEGTEEWGHATGGRDAQMNEDCVSY